MQQFLQANQVGATHVVTICTEEISPVVFRELKDTYSKVLPGENLLFVMNTEHSFHHEELVSLFLNAYGRVRGGNGIFGIVPNKDVARWLQTYGFTNLPCFYIFKDVDQALETMNG